MNEHEADRIAAAMNQARPDWPTASIRTLIRTKLMDRPRRDVFVALAWVASEPNTSTPARVLESGPWWIATGVDGQTTGRREPFDPMRFCGVCNKPDDQRHPADHPFESVLAERRKDEPNRELISRRVDRMRESIGDSKALREDEPKLAPLPSLPEVDRLRAELTTTTTPAEPEPLVRPEGRLCEGDLSEENA